MVYITKRFHFSSAHRVHNPQWSDEKNREVFGKCARINSHGHNYILEVTVAGLPDPETGYVMDLTEMKKTVGEILIDKVDHFNLNEDVDFLKGVNPTVENMIMKFWDILKRNLSSSRRSLYSLKLFESENNIAEYRGADN